MNNDFMQMMPSFVMLAAFMAIMYFLLIRPQRKREKEISEMRASLGVGDEIVTIGGIVGKVVKVGEEELVIQVGSDKTKILVKKWAISALERKSGAKTIKKNADKEESDTEKEDKKKKTPKRLKKEKEEVKEQSEEAE